MSFKEKLKEYRLKAGYLQAKEFAKFADVPYTSYIGYEKGNWPNETNLVKIALALHVSVDELLDYRNDENELEKAIEALNYAGFDVEIATIGEGKKKREKYRIKNASEGGRVFAVINTKEELIKLVKDTQQSTSCIKKVKQVLNLSFSDALLRYNDTITGAVLDALEKLTAGNEKITTSKVVNTVVKSLKDKGYTLTKDDVYWMVILMKDMDKLLSKQERK